MSGRPKYPLEYARLIRQQPVISRENRPPDAVTMGQLSLVEMQPPPQLAALINVHNPYLRCYALGTCSVIVTKEFDSFHLSISHKVRLPTWHEVSQARYRLLPADRIYAMILPPVDDYININPNCFQLVEVVPPAVEVGPFVSVPPVTPEGPLA